jgi:acetyltransferase (GNAT) family protein
MSVTAASPIQAMLLTEAHAELHAEAIAAFYRKMWNPTTTAESFMASRRKAAAENVAAPGEPPPIAIVLEGQRVIGYCGSVPQRLWDGVAEHPAYWVKGLMVLPEYRGGPIGYLVWKEIAAHLSHAAMMIVTPAARRLFSAMGYTDLGAVTNFVRLLRPGRLAQRLDVAQLALRLPRWLTVGLRFAQRTGLAGVGGIGAGLVADIAAAATRGGARRFATTWASEPPSREELDELWRCSRKTIPASPVRDGLYLRWRFGVNGSPPPLGPEGNENRYVYITAREGTRLVGVAVLLQPREASDPRLRGARVATISDLVFPAERGAVGLALLAGSERVARESNGDAILCSASHHAVVRLLRRQMYVPLPGNVHFFHRDGTGGTRWPPELASWWLMRGDGGADEVF